MPKLTSSISKDEQLDFLAVHAPETWINVPETTDFLNQYIPGRDVRFDKRPPNTSEIQYIKCVRRYEWALMMLEAKDEANRKVQASNRKKNL